MILPCKCTNKFQDARYGKGRRVHTEAQGNKRNTKTCTVCGASKN